MTPNCLFRLRDLDACESQPGIPRGELARGKGCRSRELWVPRGAMAAVDASPSGELAGGGWVGGCTRGGGESSAPALSRWLRGCQVWLSRHVCPASLGSPRPRPVPAPTPVKCQATEWLRMPIPGQGAGGEGVGGERLESPKRDRPRPLLPAGKAIKNLAEARSPTLESRSFREEEVWRRLRNAGAPRASTTQDRR